MDLMSIPAIRVVLANPIPRDMIFQLFGTFSRPAKLAKVALPLGPNVLLNPREETSSAPAWFLMDLETLFLLQVDA